MKLTIEPCKRNTIRLKQIGEPFRSQYAIEVIPTYIGSRAHKLRKKWGVSNDHAIVTRFFLCLSMDVETGTWRWWAESVGGKQLKRSTLKKFDETYYSPELLDMLVESLDKQVEAHKDVFDELDTTYNTGVKNSLVEVVLPTTESHDFPTDLQRAMCERYEDSARENWEPCIEGAAEMTQALGWDVQKDTRRWSPFNYSASWSVYPAEMSLDVRATLEELVSVASNDELVAKIKTDYPAYAQHIDRCVHAALTGAGVALAMPEYRCALAEVPLHSEESRRYGGYKIKVQDYTLTEDTPEHLHDFVYQQVEAHAEEVIDAIEALLGEFANELEEDYNHHTSHEGIWDTYIESCFELEEAASCFEYIIQDIY